MKKKKKNEKKNIFSGAVQSPSDNIKSGGKQDKTRQTIRDYHMVFRYPQMYQPQVPLFAQRL